MALAMNTFDAVAFEGSRRFHVGDVVFKGLLWASAVIILVTLAAILAILYSSGSIAFKHFGVGFLS